MSMRPWSARQGRRSRAFGPWQPQGDGLQGVDGEMHEAQRLQVLRAEPLVEGEGQLVAAEDRPDETAGAARPAARRRLLHEGPADAAAPCRRIDPEIDDV